jgi:hypothetical protein
MYEHPCLIGSWFVEGLGFGLLGREDIAKEDLFDIFGLDARALNGS